MIFPIFWVFVGCYYKILENISSRRVPSLITTRKTTDREDQDKMPEESYHGMRNQQRDELRMSLLRNFVDKLFERIATWNPLFPTHLMRSLYDNLSEHWQEIWEAFEKIYIVDNERLVSSVR